MVKRAPGQTATTKGHTMYWHITRWYGRELWLGGIKTRVTSARIVSTGQAVKFDQTFEPTERLHLFDLPEKAPDPDMTVVALECDGPPRQELGAGCVWIPGIP